jgi:hypothetical protein
MTKQDRKQLADRLESNIYFLTEFNRHNQGFVINYDLDRKEGEPETLLDIIQDLEDIRQEIIN